MILGGNHCSSGVHCRTCRTSTPAGRKFRLAFGGKEEFDCPYGKPMEGRWVRPPLPVASEEEIAALFEKDKRGGCGCSADEYRKAGE